MVGFEKPRFIKESLPQEMLCKLCSQIMKDPCQCENCKIWACQSCTSNACSHSSCHHKFAEVNKFLKNKIDDLSLKCRFFIHGCEVIKKVREIEAHEQVCQFNRYVCNNEECLREQSKKNVKQHTGECPFSMVTCEKGCKKLMRKMEESTHNCVAWLLKVVENLEIKNDVLRFENKELNGRIDTMMSTYNENTLNADKEISNLQAENGSLKEKVQSLSSSLEAEKQSSKLKTLAQMERYHDSAKTQLNHYVNKSDYEFQLLSSRLTEQVNSYMDIVKRNLLEYNTRVQVDSADLINVPADLKELDKNPIKKVGTTPQKANLNGSKNGSLNKSGGSIGSSGGKK